MHSFKNAIFARHVVCPGRHRPKRRTAHHELLIAEAQQVSQIRVATGKLLDGHRECGIELAFQHCSQSLTHIALERIPIELLAGPDGFCI